MKNQVTHLIQPPAVAGLFYPAAPDRLQDDVDCFLNEARSGGSPEGSHSRRIKAIIAPHAGYIYSGAIAAQAYVKLLSQANEIHRVLIFAPAKSSLASCRRPRSMKMMTPWLSWI